MLESISALRPARLRDAGGVVRAGRRISSSARTRPARRACSRPSRCSAGAAPTGPRPTASSSAGAPTSPASRAASASDVLEVAIQRSGRRRPAVGASGSGSTASAAEPAALGRTLRVVLFAPEEMLLVIGSPSLRRAALDLLAAARFPAYADDLSTYGRTLQQRNGLLRAIREETRRRATSCASGTATLLDAGGRVVDGAPAAARRARRAARRGPRRDRPGRGRGRPADAALRDQRAGRPGRDAARRPGPPAGRDGREGGLERLDAHRAAPRRPRLRPRRARPGRLRLARPAAHGHPRLQAGRARPADRARRPAAAAPPRRRLQRARPGPARRTSSGASPTCPRRS